MPNYTIVCGTNRKKALSLEIGKLYQQILESHGIISELLDLTQLPAQFIQTALYENAGKDPEFNAFREAMLNTDKFIFILPEYNGSYPGVLKAFIDGLQYPDTFKNKKAALVALSSGGQGGALAMSHLTDILNYCGTHVLANKPKLTYIEKHFDPASGELEPKYLDRIEKQAKDFVSF